MIDTTPYDAIVVGGGPAGSTTAALLAKHGRRVLLLERDDFPRYHIGESLIPYCWFTLNRLGVVDQLNATAFVKKYSVQFVSQKGRVSQPFYFSEHMNGHPASQAWQVVRGDLDTLLLDNARSLGVDVRHGMTVRSLLEDPDGKVIGVRAVDAAGDDFLYHAAVTVDASGRDSLAITRQGWRVPDTQLKKVAIWTYYKGALRDEGIDEGATTVAYVDHQGWFWYIPLPDDTVSVGVVGDRAALYTDGRSPDEILAHEIAKNPWIATHLAPGTQTGPCKVTGDFSYRSRHCAADGLVLVGDAFSFLDPVFSSGVFLALLGGELAADAIHAALEAGDVSGERFSGYGESLCHAIEAMRQLVYAFYDRNFSFRDLFMKYPELRGDVTDCLIGHAQRDYRALFAAMAEFAELPPPLPHGKPRTLVT